MFLWKALQIWLLFVLLCFWMSKTFSVRKSTYMNKIKKHSCYYLCQLGSNTQSDSRQKALVNPPAPKQEDNWFLHGKMNMPGEFCAIYDSEDKGNRAEMLATLMRRMCHKHQVITLQSDVELQWTHATLK